MEIDNVDPRPAGIALRTSIELGYRERLIAVSDSLVPRLGYGRFESVATTPEEFGLMTQIRE